MKFIIDQQLPPALSAWMTARGHVAEHVRSIGLRDADDAAIWRHAENTGAAIITKDQDFVSRRSAAATGPAIVWLRIGNSTTPKLLDWLDGQWPSVETELNSGAAIVEVR